MSTVTALPFLPFARPALDEATIRGVADVLDSGWITSGPKVAEFEAELSKLFAARPVRAFANGTATMETALRVAGIGPGDEVITTSITWVATANVIVAVGATPVFADIDPTTRNIDLQAVEDAITPRTRALMPVYLAGLPVDMDRLYAIARRHGLRVIEDAAQAIGSRWNEKLIGSFGDLVSFSFQANKNITCAEGGCLVLSSHSKPGARSSCGCRAWCAAARRHGRRHAGRQVQPDRHQRGHRPGTAPAAGRGHPAACRAGEGVLRGRRQMQLKDLGIVLPPPTRGQGAITNWHMFQVMLPANGRRQRAAVMQLMRDAGVGTGVHYPALHLFSYYRSLGWREGMLPHAERAGRSLLTLPLFPAMSTGDVERACAALAAACRQVAR
jgi:dTDP-4-amino-4,6-dideoxygalactose transaminase